MKKKHLALLLALVMVLSVTLTACGNKDKAETPEPAAPVEEGGEETGGEEVVSGGNQIIIGNTTELSGDWTSEWQNGAADYEFILMSRSSTVENDAMGEFHINDSLVESHEVTENEDGSKTYTLKLRDGLKWADGNDLKAKDFVASYLLWASPAIMEMGAPGNAGDKFVGYKAYNSGEAKEFSGVKLIDELTYSVTIDAANLPFFYELPLIQVAPIDINFWTGDEEMDVLDDGNGVYLSKDFTKEEHEKAITDGRYALPRPCNGAYEIVDYDETAKMATAKINPNFAGNWEGQKPAIETIIMKKINKDTQYDELKTCSIDVIFQAGGGEEINTGLDLEAQGGYKSFHYPRPGYGKLTFTCDYGPTQFVEVRQAIAYLLDRVDFANSFTGGFGSVVNGPYGEAQWMYQETKAQLNEVLNQYSYNPDEAVRLLEEGGWTLNAEGGAYTDGIRYKDVDGELMPLVIEWASSENNEVSDLLSVKLQENPDLTAAGIKINKSVMTFSELLSYVSRDAGQDPKYAVPTYGMFNLATNFPASIQSAEYNYSTDEQFMGGNYNTNFIRDEELAQSTKDMIRIDGADKEGFKENYVKYISRWNQLLPDIPLYSNEYYDFYNERITTYTNSPFLRAWEVVMYSELGE
ncbi:MAG: ABC transporter substrate-binding protein [Tissierellia bacterium]|nr:ABC transporter substrate-binding protein [Tissierellia bacterium]